MVWAEKTFPDALKVVKVNCTDGNKALMEKYKVYGLPCLIVFNGGEEVSGSHYEGAISKAKLGKYLEQHVGVSVPAA
jgi:thioredoxin-like negative regulator of GroEL